MMQSITEPYSNNHIVATPTILIPLLLSTHAIPILILIQDLYMDFRYRCGVFQPISTRAGLVCQGNFSTEELWLGDITKPVAFVKYVA
jgi:hypothetical protein